MTLHATLSPSSAERWISCPASVRLAAEVESSDDHGSVYAREGTAAHGLAEIMARVHVIGGVGPKLLGTQLRAWRKQFSEVTAEVEAEMQEHAMTYVAYLQRRMAEHPDMQLLLEQRVATGLPDGGRGTSDAVLVSPVFLEIVDFKYGLGVRVDAAGNPQLRLYGVGALEVFGDLLGDVETVRCTVFQPRLGHVDSEELPAAELRDWRDNVAIPRGLLALGPDAPFGPSVEACRWCPVSGQCRAQMEWSVAIDFGTKPELLDADELADALEHAPFITAWMAALQDHCLDAVYSKGQSIPGWKVVMSGGKRSVINHEGAIAALTDLGYEEDQVSNRKTKGIGDLEKLLRRSFDEVMGPFVRKGDGSPSLVPLADGRSSIDPETSAREDFK